MTSQTQVKLQTSPAAAKSVGRPKAITPEVVHQLKDSLRQGFNVTTACILSRISTSCYYNELARNKRFMDKMTMAQQETSLIANTFVAEAVRQGDMKTIRWYLDRQDRLAYHAQRSAQHSNTKRIVITETRQNTHSVSMEVDQ